MTANEPTTDPSHEPAPVSLVPELAVSPDVVATIRRMTSLVQNSGLMDAARAVYEVALPEYRRMVDTLDDATYAVVVERMGWSDLHDEVAELAAALMMAVGIHEVDVMLPDWITQQDRDKRDADSLRMMALLFPDLVASGPGSVAHA